MSPNEKIFKIQYSAELYGIALGDLETAKFLAQNDTIRRENVLFHVEQAVEKALKAVLCKNQIPVPLTQDLYAIVQKFAEHKLELPPSDYSLHNLTPFASIRRYEEGTYELTSDDVMNAIKIAATVLSWCKSHIGLT